MYAAQLFPTLIINQHIRITSKGSCYTEDWSNVYYYYYCILYFFISKKI